MNKSNSINKVKRIKAILALYLRISREDKDKDESYSISNQRQLLYDVAQRLGLDTANIREYIDDGITGTKRDREQFQKMLTDIEKGEIGIVMVKDLSRLARDHIQADTLIEEFFPEHDVRLIAPGDGVDTAKGEDEIIPFRNLMNEFYARDISKKRKATNFVKGNMGAPLSRPPYGYMLDPTDSKRWVIDDEPADVVKRIYAMYLDGFGIEQIAATISQEKILTPVFYWKSIGINCPGKRCAYTEPTRWGHSTVNKILGLQEYCGDIINFKTFSKSFKLKKRIPNAEEDMKIFKDIHEPVIERSMWEKVQTKRGSTRKRTTRTSSEGAKNIFSGFLICPDCGGNLNFHYNQGNHDIKYFNCANNNKARKICGSTHYIRADFLEQIVLREIQRLTAYAGLYENEFIEMVTGFVKQAGDSDMKRKEKELAKLTSRNKEIDKLFERLYEDNVSGKVNDERYYRMSANYETEQRDNGKRIKILRGELQKDNAQRYAADSFIGIVRKYLNPTELTQMMLSELVEKIEVFDAEKVDGVTVQRLNIHYHCVGEIELPEIEEAPAVMTTIHTRQGVDVVYFPKTKQAM